MKKRSIVLTTLLIAFVVIGCKIPKEFLSGLTSNPNPLELKGGKIECNVEGTFPAKYFVKNMELTVVPILKSNKTGDVLRGEPKVFQGEKIKGNNTTISYKNGGKYQQKVVFKYDPKFEKCELYMEATAKIKKKTITFEPVKVAEGINTTANLIYYNTSEIGSKIIDDNFQKKIEEKEDTEVKFLIQKSDIRSSETKGLVDLIGNVKKAKEDNSIVVKGFEVSSYASPDGGVELNEKLAENRENSTVKYIDSQMKKLKTDVGMSANFTAQDWEGFKDLMEKSDIQDKKLILDVLSMYSDPEQREKEIKNLSVAFGEIKESILPQLRRSKITLTKEIIGKSDEEIQKLLKEDASKLSVEELLYAATFTNDDKAKKEVYEKVVRYYPEDIRGYNNLGVTEFKLGNVNEADKLFTKALEMDKNNAMANLNKGSILVSKGDIEGSKVYFGNAAGAGNELNYANGAIAIAEGDYKKAVSIFGNSYTNNAALAQILNKDYSAAKNTLNNIKTPDAKTYYLQSIVAARTNNVNDLVDNATKAINADSKLKEKFLSDIEFKNYISNSVFSALLK